MTSRAGSSTKSPAAANPPPITTSSGLKMFTRRPDAGAEMPADAVEDLDRARLSFVREPHEPVRVDRRAELRLRELRRGDTR